jgi:dinuclear metal center YbgI/SA1388 family protein
MFRSELNSFFSQLLTPDEFQDYGPNGLQIEGTSQIQKIAFAVSATKESVAQAVSWQADALVVHHGLFWKFHGVRTITGPFGKRIIPLIQNSINLFGYHLPLDGHPKIGNAATIAQQLQLTELQPFGEYKKSPIGVQGKFTTPLTKQQLQQKLESLFQRSITATKQDPDRLITSMGIITGGANGGWLDAYHAGLDCYLTGEMSEHDWHDALEHEITMFAAGHHATERFGILALKKEVEREFPEVETLYIELDNPA